MKFALCSAEFEVCLDLRWQLLPIEKLPAVKIVREDGLLEAQLLHRHPRVVVVDVPQRKAQDRALKDSVCQRVRD